jgi:hypothetical protein
MASLSRGGSDGVLPDVRNSKIKKGCCVAQRSRYGIGTLPGAEDFKNFALQHWGLEMTCLRFGEV